MKRFTILLAIALSFFSLKSNAQSDTVDIYDLSLEELMNIKVTSVSKMSESVMEAPQTVIVISEDDIRKRGYTDLEQILHDLPGFDISRSAGCEYSHVYQRGYRSNNTDRTMIMIDGVEQNDLWSSSAWIARQYPISNIKRVEVVYGPASTVYGANAFLGVINVITKEDDDILKDKKYFGVSAQAGYGTWNTKYADVNILNKYKDISLNITGRYFQSDNMDLSKYEFWDFDLSKYDIAFYKTLLGTENNDTALMAKNFDEKGYLVDGKKHTYENKSDNYFINAKLTIKDFSITFQNWRRADQYGAWYNDIYEFGSWVPSHTYLYSKYETKISDKFTIANYNTFKINRLEGTPNKDYWFVGYVNGGLSLANLSDTNKNNDQSYWYTSHYGAYSQQFRSEVKTIYEINSKFNITSGIEYRQSLIQGNYLVSVENDPEENAATPNVKGGNHFYSRDIGLYAQLNYKPIEDLSVVLGGRYDNNRIRINGGYGSVFNPKIAIVYSPSNFIFKAIYSEAFKDADNLFKYSTTTKREPNPGLQPEKVKNAELSAGYQFNKNLFFDVTAYDANYSNIMSEVAIGNGKIQSQAIGKLHIQGIQSRINFKYRNYSAFAYFTYTNPYNTENDKKIRIGDIADFSVVGGGDATFFKKLTVSLTGNYIGEKPTGKNTTVSTNPNTSIDEYFILNGALTYLIYKGITGQIVVNNITNLEYFDPGIRTADGSYYSAKIPQNERSFMFKLIYDL